MADVQSVRINFNANIEGDNAFKCFKYRAKLFGNTEADGANGILKNTITVTLKYLSNFWRSFEVPPINCKVQLKFKWMNYCFVCK